MKCIIDRSGKDQDWEENNIDSEERSTVRECWKEPLWEWNRF